MAEALFKALIRGYEKAYYNKKARTRREYTTKNNSHLTKTRTTRKIGTLSMHVTTASIIENKHGLEARQTSKRLTIELRFMLKGR